MSYLANIGRELAYILPAANVVLSVVHTVKSSTPQLALSRGHKHLYKAALALEQAWETLPLELCRNLCAEIDCLAIEGDCIQSNLHPVRKLVHLLQHPVKRSRVWSRASRFEISAEELLSKTRAACTLYRLNALKARDGWDMTSEKIRHLNDVSESIASEYDSLKCVSSRLSTESFKTLVNQEVPPNLAK